jgi:2-methylcitrate dehydratase PrpD
MHTPTEKTLKDANRDSISATRLLAEFTVQADGFPEAARARAVDAITDCVGCMLAGRREPLAEALLRTLTVTPNAAPYAPAMLAGTGYHAPAADAALFNGAIAHALDYDDTNHPAYAHPSAVIVPVLLAAAALRPCSGRDWVDAYILGLEVFGKLGRVLNTAHYKRGWHATATFGTLAATVVAGRLLGLDVPTMEMAIGIAVSSTGGARINFGSMVKPLHAGLAARNGLQAAMMAANGLASSTQTLEGRYGYFELFGNADADASHFQNLGKPLEIMTEYGLALKPYPACGATHPGIEAALALHGDLAGAPIQSVHAGVCEMAFEPLIYVEPKGALQGKFSLHYCLAAALVDGQVNLATFTDEKIADPRILALIPRISMEVDERLRHNSEFATRVTVTTQDGRTFEREVMLAQGKPDRWMNSAQLKRKFDDCCANSLPAARRDGLFDALQSLDQEGGNVAGLIESLSN